jgi:hypothetical protein
MALRSALSVRPEPADDQNSRRVKIVEQVLIAKVVSTFAGSAPRGRAGGAAMKAAEPKTGWR